MINWMNRVKLNRSEEKMPEVFYHADYYRGIWGFCNFSCREGLLSSNTAISKRMVIL